MSHFRKPVLTGHISPRITRSNASGSGVIPFVFLWLLLTIGGCSPQQRDGAPTAMDSTLVIAMLGDAEYLNPVIGASVTSSNVFGLIYPGLLESRFDTSTGLLNFIAMEKSLLPAEHGAADGKRFSGLARSWSMADDHRSITYTLRDDVAWDDGVPITAADIAFTYRLYGDPVIASPRQQYLAELEGADSGAVDFDRAVEALDATTVVFRFYKPVSERLALFHTSLSPIPAHVWKDVSPGEFRRSSLNQQPLGAGPYRLHQWSKQQELVLESNPLCRLPEPGNINRIMFRIVPDYTVRLAQLQTGTVDVVENIKPEDFQGLEAGPADVEIKSTGLRVYDYVGWSNIDQDAWNSRKEIMPHPLFGSPAVRRALTMAIDRQSIIDGYLGEYGTMCTGDISPSLKWAFNDTITPWPHDPREASKLLASEGWVPGPDGILRKEGKRFSFTLYTNAGNARRNYAGVIIQQNLRDIGIECRLEVQESNVFFENLRQRRLDAWMAGWSVGLEIDPLDGWGSDLDKSRFNFTGYRNPRIDELCELAKDELDPMDARPYWMEYQDILHQDQPTTFLYWIRETQGFSKRIRGEELSILGTFYNIDDWSLDPSRAVTP